MALGFLVFVNLDHWAFHAEGTVVPQNLQKLASFGLPHFRLKILIDFSLSHLKQLQLVKLIGIKNDIAWVNLATLTRLFARLA